MNTSNEPNKNRQPERNNSEEMGPCRFRGVPFDVQLKPSNEKERAMRFLCYTLGDESIPVPPPTPELVTEMGAFMEDATNAGVLVATGGVAPTALGARVQYAGGKFTVTDGPFAEAK